MLCCESFDILQDVCSDFEWNVSDFCKMNESWFLMLKVDFFTMNPQPSGKTALRRSVGTIACDLFGPLMSHKKRIRGICLVAQPSKCSTCALSTLSCPKEALLPPSIPPSMWPRWQADLPMGLAPSAVLNRDLCRFGIEYNPR